MIKEASEHFVTALSAKPALIPLYKNKEMVCEINGNEERVWLHFHDGSCQLMLSEPDHVDVTLSGDSGCIASLLRGADRLMRMEEEGRITANGSLRYLLSLESLFVLTGETSPILHN